MRHATNNTIQHNTIYLQLIHFILLFTSIDLILFEDRFLVCDQLMADIVYQVYQNKIWKLVRSHIPWVFMFEKSQLLFHILQSHWKSVTCFCFCGHQILTCGNEIVTCGHQILPCSHQILTCGNQILTCRNQILTCGNQILTCGHKIVSFKSLTCSHQILT